MSRIGYIGFKPQQPVDGILATCVGVLRDRGVPLAGVVQAHAEDCADCAAGLNFRDIEDGDIIRYSQDLGPGSDGCALDPQALAAVSQRIVASLARHPRLVVINRFGKAESDGHGLRAVIEAALVADIPLLVAVRDDFIPGWEAFHGGLAERLPVDETAVLQWCERAVAEAA